MQARSFADLSNNALLQMCVNFLKEEEDEYRPENVTFAPKDVVPVDLTPKDNVHGLGYKGLDPTKALFGSSEEHIDLFNPSAENSSLGDLRHSKGRKLGISGQVKCCWLKVFSPLLAVKIDGLISEPMMPVKMFEAKRFPWVVSVPSLTYYSPLIRAGESTSIAYPVQLILLQNLS